MLIFRMLGIHVVNENQFFMVVQVLRRAIQSIVIGISQLIFDDSARCGALHFMSFECTDFGIFLLKAGMMANEIERPADDRTVMNGNHADQSGSSPLPIPTIKITKVSVTPGKKHRRVVPRARYF